MIVYLTYISFGFIFFVFLNVIINFAFRQKLKKAKDENINFVSVLIPARNEEENIGLLLNDLSQMNNENLEIIVLDDLSTDNTASIVKSYIDKDSRIQLIQSKKLSKGWLGKNYACYRLAKIAKGSFYLFVDADVRLKNNIIDDAVGFLIEKKLSLLSIFPNQITQNIGEKVSVPIMNYILLSLLPLPLVEYSPFSSHSAANGQFMLFNKEEYDKIQPHKLFKSSAVEDINISRFYKKNNNRIACLIGEKRIKCRMYKNYNEALNGFGKNIFMFFGNIPILAFLFWIFTALGFIPIAIYKSSYLIAYFSIFLLIQIMYSLSCKQNIIVNIVLFPVQLLFFLKVMIKSLVANKQKKYIWKGRNIY